MNSEEMFRLANTDSFVEISGLTTNRTFLVRKHTYGVLVPDQNHPLSCVSVSNSSISIDLWVGCALQCAYCHVQGTAEDLADHGRMPKRPQRRSRFSVEEVVGVLIDHPFFIANESVISIGTASTEPFASQDVTESTFEIMDAFLHRGLRNPMWIVTKNGIPKGCKQSMARVVKGTKGLMISLCWADNPKQIEPAGNNRFIRCDEAKDAGATIAWYMRPMVPEWSGTPEKVEMMMLWVKHHYGKYIDMIVPGGLRWTEGIENGLTEIHRVSMPDIPKDDNVKDLPESLWDEITRLAKEHFPGIPVFRRSSCALTHMLGTPSIGSVQDIAVDDCEGSICPATQRQTCGGCSLANLTTDDVQNVIRELHIPLTVETWTSPILRTIPPLENFTYAIQQTVKKALSGRSIQKWRP